jgi:hypothetical protein
MEHTTVQLSPFSRYFITLRSKYSPQQPVLKHFQNFGPCCLFYFNFTNLLLHSHILLQYSVVYTFFSAWLQLTFFGFCQAPE